MFNRFSSKQRSVKTMTINENILDLDPPRIPDALPNFPDSQVNLLPLTALESPLLVLIPEWSDLPTTPGMQVVVSLLFNEQQVAQYQYTTPINPALFPLNVHIPKHHLVEGAHRVSYIMTVFERPMPSASTPITVDTSAPNRGNPGHAPNFPLDVIRDGITQSYLDENGDEVLVTIPRYLQQQACDSIELHYGSLTDKPVIVKTVHDSISPTKIKLSGEIIRRYGSGKMLAFYRLGDRAGNRGSISEFAQINVNLS